VPALFALLASAVWGTSDFAGGTLARRVPPLPVVFLGIALACGVLVLGEPLARAPIGAYSAYGAGAGLVGAVALVAFYRAMAAGPMSLVAPLSATGTAIPVLWALARGEPMTALRGAGLVLAFAGVLLACGPKLRHGPRVARSTLLYAMVSAAGFGCYFVLFALGSATSVYGTLLSQRTAGVLFLAPLGLRALRSPEGLLGGERLGRDGVALLVLSGLGDVAANGLYGLAARRAGAGLAVVTVLSSLYPVASILLARAVHGERLRAVQNVGVAAALGGVLLLNA